VKRQLKPDFETQETAIYQREYPPEVSDLRNSKKTPENLPKYYQVFEDRIGFIPDLSILDMLFSEGPEAKKFITKK